MAREDGGFLTDISDQAMWEKPAPVQQPKQHASMIFGPGVPVMPINPLDRPRTFQYRPGINLVIIPRYGYGLADFPTLRNLAAACKEIRLNIELIKREVRSLDWKIVPQQEGEKTDYSKDIAEIQAFLEEPDGNQMDFDSWINAALEEALVTDALTIYPSMSGGELQALDLIDGTTIRPVLDYRGKIAKSPMPGYMQTLYGMPAGWWTTSEMIYRPINASVNSPYGTSPIEFIMLAVNLALRRETYHLGYYTEGNVPESLVGLPSTWSQGQIETWQSYWDSLLTGNITQQRKMHFMPRDGAGGLPVYEFKRDNVDMTAQDEWLMKVACWAFGNSPQEFGLVSGGQGLGGAGYAGAMEDVHQRSMIAPVSQYLQRILTKIIHVHKRKPWLKFQWVGLDPSEDMLKQAQVDQINVGLGVYDLGYIQERDGIPQEHRPSAPPPQAENMFDVPFPEVDGVRKFFRKQGYAFADYPEDAFAGGEGTSNGDAGVLRGAEAADRSSSTIKKDFDESKYPRADDGKFGSGSGNSGGSGGKKNFGNPGPHDKFVSFKGGIKGKNENRLVGYQHIRTLGEKHSETEGNYGAKVSDFERAIPCKTCGRPIVHAYYVQDPDGNIEAYGSDHLHESLGYDKPLTPSQADKLVMQLEGEHGKKEGRKKELLARVSSTKGEANMHFNRSNPNLSEERRMNTAFMYHEDGGIIRVDKTNPDDIEIMMSQGFSFDKPIAKD